MSMRWPRAGALALEQRRREREGAGHAGRVVDHRRAELHRMHVLGAGHRHDAGGRLDHVVVGGLAAARALLAERRERGIDQPRIDLRQRLVAEAERLERAGAIVLDEHVGGGDQLLQHLAVGLGLQVERDRALVRRLGQERGAHVAVVERLVGAAAAALVGIVGMLDLDHVGAQHRELIGRERPRQHMGGVDDPDTLERSHAYLSLHHPSVYACCACHRQVPKSHELSGLPHAQLSPAVARNRDPILAVLRRHLPDAGHRARDRGGTGEHAAYFAPQFPHLVWQPTDVDPDALASIEAHRAAAGAPNLRAPIALDVTAPAWPVTRADAVVSINMIHISPWAAAQGLMAGAARLLPDGRRALSLRAVQGERRAHGAEQCRVRREPARPRSRNGACATPARSARSPTATVSISSSASPCRRTI